MTVTKGSISRGISASDRKRRSFGDVAGLSELKASARKWTGWTRSSSSGAFYCRRIAGVIHRTGWLANDATSRCFLAGEESAEEYRSRGRGVSGTHTNDHSFHRDAYAFAPRLRLNRLMPTENRSYAPRTHRTRALYSSKRIWVAGGGGSTTTWLLSKNPPAKRVNFSPRVCSRSDSRGNRQRVDEGWIELSSSLLLRDVQTGWRLAYQRISVGSSFEPASKVSSIGQQR